MASLMEVFEGGSLEMKVMEKVGCQKYSATQWESDKSNEYQRQIHYKFSKKLSPVGGEVTGTQQKSPMPNKKGWIIEEVMELQGVLLGDFFTVCIHSSIFCSLAFWLEFACRRCCAWKVAPFLWFGLRQIACFHISPGKCSWPCIAKQNKRLNWE